MARNRSISTSHTASRLISLQQERLLDMVEPGCQRSTLRPSPVLSGRNLITDVTYRETERVAEWLSHSAVNKKSQVQIPALPKVLGSDGVICKYLPSWIYLMFSMHVYSLFGFVLANYVTASRQTWCWYIAAYYIRAKPSVTFGCCREPSGLPQMLWVPDLVDYSSHTC